MPKVALASLLSVVAVALAAFCYMSAADRLNEESLAIHKSYFGGQSAARWTFQSLADNNPHVAFTQARRAVQTDPINPASTSALASANLALGNMQAAYAAFSIAGGLGWRDVPTQLFWLAQALAVNDIGVARDRLDALLRLNIDNDAVDAALASFEQTSAGQQALASLLQRDPPWASCVLGETGKLTDGAFAGRMAAISLAASHGANLDCGAVGAAASQLIVSGRIGDAKTLWRQACDRNGDVYISDGGFETDLTKALDNPFDWRLQNSGGLGTSIVSAPSPLVGQALRIDSSNTVRTIAARQLMALSPGTYRLSWQTALEGGQADGSIDVFVRCAGTTSMVYRNDDDFPTRGNAVAKIFTVPASDCPIQEVDIQKAASASGNNETGWVDNIRVAPIDAS